MSLLLGAALLGAAAALITGAPPSGLLRLAGWRPRSRLLAAAVASILGGVLLSPPAGLVAGAGALWASGLSRSEAQARGADTLQWLQALDRALAHATSFPEAWLWSTAETPPGPLREALLEVVRRYQAGISWAAALAGGAAGVREGAARSLFGILGLCAHSQVSLRAARMALAEIAPSLQGVLDTEAQLRAGTAAQRAQAVSLAVLVPSLSVGLQLFDPPYRAVLWGTPLGRWVLLPAALGLELGGLAWSRRLTGRLGG